MVWLLLGAPPAASLSRASIRGANYIPSTAGCWSDAGWGLETIAGMKMELEAIIRKAQLEMGYAKNLSLC
jgi:hypothetical protein